MAKITPFWIIAVILGIAAYKQIDFENLNFKNPGLGILYLLTFIFSVILIVKGRKTTKQ
ncbi:hypothetical protein HDF26_001100 [Pedobacter cryoconitis]|uniref:hypothetical protein n=1 Tax=Pedobacter cryoconitis TaxID=188932 RepID=UPI001611B7B5|nr:hypothetical protein [Pedobacter cryoconitis]MBB6270673.1 hypothetical protein [Pedobacter cryoconitis]